MFRYILKRLLYAIPVFLGITFVIYTLINLAPGGPLSVLAASGEMSLSDLEALKISMGLDKPIVIRYFIWLGDLLHGDFWHLLPDFPGSQSDDLPEVSCRPDAHGYRYSCGYAGGSPPGYHLCL